MLSIMTKPTGKPVGRPTKHGTAAAKTLGSVRVTPENDALFKQAAELEGVSRTDFVTSELVRAAKRIIKKHGAT